MVKNKSGLRIRIKNWTHELLGKRNYVFKNVTFLFSNFLLCFKNVFQNFKTENWNFKTRFLEK